MPNLSLYTKLKLQDHLHEVSSFTMPAAGYWALFLTDPCPGNSAGTTPTGTEASYTGYARVAGTFGADSGGVSANNSTITFPVNAGAGGGTANFLAWMDAITTGHLLEGFTMAPIVINSGTSISFAIGAVTSTVT